MHEPCGGWVFTKRIQAGLPEDFICQRGRSIATSFVFFHKLRSQRPMLNCRDHVFTDTETSNCVFVSKNTFWGAGCTEGVDRIKSLSQPQLSERGCLVHRKM